MALTHGTVNCMADDHTTPEVTENETGMPSYLAARLERLAHIRQLVNEGRDVPPEDANFLLGMVDRLGATVIAQAKRVPRP